MVKIIRNKTQTVAKLLKFTFFCTNFFLVSRRFEHKIETILLGTQ